MKTQILSITRSDFLKTLRPTLDYLIVIKYLCFFILFLVFNCLEKTVLPYSTAIFVAVLMKGASVIATPILFLLSFVVLGEFGLIAPVSIICALLVLITCLYRKFNAKMRYEFVAYTLVSLAGFLFLGNTINQLSFERRIITVAITTLLTFLSIISSTAIFDKGFKFKLGYEEFSALALLTAVCGLGICNLVTPLAWKGLSILIILLVSYLYRTGTVATVSALLGLSLAVFYRDLNFVSVFIVIGIVAECVKPVSRYLSALSVIAVEFILNYLFNLYPAYTPFDLIPVLAGAVTFIILPNKLLKLLKDKLYIFKERQLVRETINRNRLMLSGRLYDLSGVFMEMAGAYNSFKKAELTKDKAKCAIEKQVYDCVCKECDRYEKCKLNKDTIKQSLSEMTDIGFAKGKLSLIDVPKKLGETCARPNNILYNINRLLADYRSYLIEKQNVTEGRNLLASEVKGIAEILSSLALESGTQLKYNGKVERILSDGLSKAGFLVSELLVYGEADRLTLSMIINMKEFNVNKLLSVIKKILGKEFYLQTKTQVSERKCYLTFKIASAYDVAFGISRLKKDGSIISGDTHSATRINDDRFLFALSDGMGSGEQAQTISSVALSLIESFYKAGLNSQIILNTVNKLLAVNSEDSFTALDISVIDLNSCCADFIKYGAPYGFIINKNGIKIVEGNSLPLGIIDDLKPSVATTKLEDGDMILLVTDGISDAFGCSGEIINYLRTQPALNPQTLANNVMEMAKQLNDGQCKDDMTALAVRVFKKPA